MLEKAKRIQIQKDMKDKEANRFAIEKAQIEVFIEKHRPHTLKTPDEVSRSGKARMPKLIVKRGMKRKNPHIKRQQRISRLKSPAKREKKPKTPKEAIQIHYWVIWWLIPQQVQKKGKKIKLA